MSLPGISSRLHAAELAAGLIVGSGAFVPAFAANDESAPAAHSEDTGTLVLSDAGASARVEFRLKGGKYIKQPVGSTTGKRVVADSWITTRVNADLLADGISKGFEVNVATMNGVVFLSGTLASEDAIDHARDISAKVEGVRSVDTSALFVFGR